MSTRVEPREITIRWTCGLRGSEHTHDTEAEAQACIDRAEQARREAEGVRPGMVVALPGGRFGIAVAEEPAISEQSGYPTWRVACVVGEAVSALPGIRPATDAEAREFAEFMERIARQAKSAVMRAQVESLRR